MHAQQDLLVLRGNQVFYSLRARRGLNWYACVEGVLQQLAAEVQVRAVGEQPLSV